MWEYPQKKNTDLGKWGSVFSKKKKWWNGEKLVFSLGSWGDVGLESRRV